jgi:hypothetical protein
MSGAVPSFPHTSSWRGPELSTGTTLPVPLPADILYIEHVLNIVINCGCVTHL